jgi:RHS repeat-associated protein
MQTAIRLKQSPLRRRRCLRLRRGDLPGILRLRSDRQPRRCMGPSTSHIYMQARFYDPQVGRFLSTDPVHFSDQSPFTFNRYAYANNNPYRYTDPDGRQAGELTTWPVPGYGDINQADKPGEGGGNFGDPRSTSQGPSTHAGIDIQAPVGTPVVAAGGGTVVNVSPNPSATYGNQVVIDHGKGVNTQSAHMGTTSAKPGDTVKAGQQIGTVGTTGNTPKGGDAHLHFEVRVGGSAPRSQGGTVADPTKHLPPPPKEEVKTQ